jgi:thiamine-monophosphate kinase
MLENIRENNFINTITQNFSRSPMQLNGVHQSDSELIRLKMGRECILAITTDSIAEEISTGLYEDPYLAGWMTAMANFSDLAAVGANPIGLLTSLILPKEYAPEKLERLQDGIKDACCACNTFLLGGDVNSGEKLILTGCAAGIIDGEPVITRTGIETNDLVYTSGYLGSGNSFALTKLFQIKNTDFDYKPFAKLTEGQLIRKWATACMDTSDGLISTLDQMMRLNNKGFCIENKIENFIDSDSQNIFSECNIPLWLSLAAQHGEFELLFTIPESQENLFLVDALNIDWQPIKLGRVIESLSIELSINGKLVNIDSTRIRNLATEPDFDVNNYLNSLLKIDRELL